MQSLKFVRVSQRSRIAAAIAECGIDGHPKLSSSLAALEKGDLCECSLSSIS